MKYLRSWDAAAISFLIVWPWVEFWQATFGIKAFSGGDIFQFFHPIRLALARALNEGRLPLWEPGMQAGFPLFAEGQVAALYPPNLLLFPLLPTTLAISYSILLHLFWASVGMYCMCRAYGLATPAALFAGFVLSNSGFFLAHLQHLSLIATASWLPWLIFLQIRYQQAHFGRARNSLIWFLLLSFAIAFQFLSGFPQIALLNLFALGSIGMLAPLWNSFERHDIAISPMIVVKRAGAILASILLGLGLAAIQLLPTAELVGFTSRGKELGLEFFTSYSFDPTALSQFFLPFGTDGAPTAANQEFWGFFGVSTLFLSIIAPFLRRSGTTLLFLLVGIIALCLMLGNSTPVYELLYNIPFINRFRVPARFLFLVTFAATFLAACSIDELQKQLADRSTSSRSAIGVGFVVGLLLTVVSALRDSISQELWRMLWSFLPWISLACSIFLTWSVSRRYLHRNQFVTLFLGLAFVELALFAPPMLIGLGELAPQSELTDMPANFRAMGTPNPLYRVLTNYSSPLLLWNRPMVFGIHSSQNYTPLSLQRNDEYLNAMSRSMFNLMNIRYVIEPVGGLEESKGVLPGSVLLKIFKSQIDIPPTRAVQLEISSFTNDTAHLRDGFLVGELRLTLQDQQIVTVPIRLGMETAEWNYAVLSARSQVRHGKPPNAVPFGADQPSALGNFKAFKFIARYDLSSDNPVYITSVNAYSHTSYQRVAIERVFLIDEQGHRISLAELAGLNDYAVVFIDDKTDLLENLNVMPRAFIVHSAEVVSDDRSIERMHDQNFDPSRVVYLSTGDPMNTMVSPDATEQANIIDYEAERVVIHARVARQGYLVLTDSWYPGWEARIDGVSADIHRADYVFRAVRLEAGEHEVVFEYRPVSLFIGAAISTTSLLLSMGLVWVFWRR